MVNEMIWHDVMMCMLCTKKKCKVMKPIYWIYTNKVLQGIQTKPCNEFKLLGKESKQVTQVALGLSNA